MITKGTDWIDELLLKHRDFILEMNDIPELIFQSERHLTTIGTKIEIIKKFEERERALLEELLEGLPEKKNTSNSDIPKFKDGFVAGGNWVINDISNLIKERMK